MNTRHLIGILASEYGRLPVVTMFIVLGGCSGGSNDNDSGGSGNGGAGQQPKIGIQATSAVVEGDAEASLEFIVSLSGASTSDVTVEYASRDGSAVVDQDYTGISGTLVIEAGATSGTIEVPLVDDGIDEPDESVLVELLNASGATIQSDFASGTILDDDPASEIAILNAEIAEGDSGTATMSFSVTLDRVSGKDVALDYATEQATATSGEDFHPASGTLTLAAGQSSSTIGVVVLGDVLAETHETLSLVLSNPLNGTLATSEATGTIRDDDPDPRIDIVGASQLEGDSGSSEFEFVLSLSEASGQVVSAEFSTADVSAQAGTDYAATQGTVVFMPGDTTEVVSVLVFGDDQVEGNESFLVALTNVVNAAAGADTATGEIQNDDTAAPGEVVVSAASASSVAEGGVGATLYFGVALSETANEDIDVRYSTRGGSATAGEDFDDQNATVRILAGQLSVQVPVAIIDDALDEFDETVFVDLLSTTSGTLGTSSARGIIVDDDPSPGIAVHAAVLDEGDAATSIMAFDVLLGAVSGKAIEVDYSTADATALAGSDYTAANGTLKLPPGVAGGSVQVSITGDTLHENDETFLVSLANAVNATLTTLTASGTIRNDDSEPALSVSGGSVPEGDAGTGSVAFQVSLDRDSALKVTVNYATADATATAGSDYVAASGSLTIPAGSTMATVNVPVNGDTLWERDESFSLTLSNPTNATLGTATASGMLQNDDTAPAISIAGTSAAEGDAGNTVVSVTVSLSGVSGLPAQVNFATADGTAQAGSDYIANAGQLTIPAGTTAGSFNITVSGDAVYEADETIGVTISNPVDATLATSAATVVITNDDAMPVLGIGDSSVWEGDAGDSSMVFTVSLDAVAGVDVSADYASAVGTATGADFTGAGGTATIAAGTTTAMVVVPVTGDTLDESDETFTVTLSNVENATLGNAVGTGTIVDDDPLPSLSIADGSVIEGDSGSSNLSLVISLGAASGRTITVDYASADVTATAGSDYTAISGTLTINAGNTSATLQLPVSGDTLYEADETATVTLGNAVNATVSAGQGTATLNNDDSPPTVSISPASRAEGDSGSANLLMSVSLDAASGLPVGVDFSTLDNTATAGSDYVAASGTVNIAAGDTSGSIAVAILGDTTDETDETFTMTLTNPVNSVLATGTASGTIIDDDAPAGTFGLDARPDNQTCVAPARPTANASVSVVDAFPSLPDIPQPTKMLLEPVADPRWFVLQKTGELVTFDPDNAISVSVYLDLSAVVRTEIEGGLLGLAFHPDYPATPEIFLSYTINHSGPPMRSVLSRFILDDTTSPGVGTVEQVILQIDQDFDNHNGGDIAFGPDGYLYFGVGDGGDSGDPNNRAQDTTNLLGAMLRIDVTAPGAVYPVTPYVIPVDNPFSGNSRCGPGINATDCPEIFAWGLRNPWRWSFDPSSGQLWLADVGQSEWEEINLVELGGNYGWRCREGAHDFNSSGCGTGFIDPVAEYSHGFGNSITGGYVYRGVAIPELIGRYVFSDYGSGRFWALQSNGQGGFTSDQLIDTNFGPTSFGVDSAGELYFTDINNSRLRKLVPAGAGTPDTIPTNLSDSGCTDPSDITQPYAGLVPYDLNAPFWSDGAAKERYIGLPNGMTIARTAENDWEFPNGTVIVKNFRLGGDLVETRHLMRHLDGVWAGYTYEWNAVQTEATRVQGGKTVNIGGQDYIFPSEAECMACHTSTAGFALGPETAQMNRDFTYPSTGRTANQLETYDHILMFTSPLPGPASGLVDLADPADTGETLTDRARAYLHTNCSQCHRPMGPTPSAMDLRYDTALSNTNACDVVPTEGELGISNARLIAPGDSSRSIIVNRMSRRDSHGMPPVGSNIVDSAGATLIAAWIDNLVNCN